MSAAPRPIRLEDVVDSPFQPRKRALSKKDVAELMSSIDAVGQVTPIVVSPMPEQAGKYVVHAGHRRCAALRFLGATTVAAVVRHDLDERTARKLAVGDNIGREDLTAYEQAIALQDYAQAFAVGFEEAGRELGVQARTAYRLKVLLGGSRELQALVRDGGIAAKAADLLVKLEGANKRRALRLAEQYGAGALGIADLEQAARGAAPAKRPTAVGKDIELKVDDQRLVLTARLTFEAVTDEQRARFTSAVGAALKRLGIARVEAESTTA